MNHKSVTVASWNMLADCYAVGNRGDYAKNPSLKWDYRGKMISIYLQKSSVNIFCLQEVDHKPKLASNYKILHTQRYIAIIKSKKCRLLKIVCASYI